MLSSRQEQRQLRGVTYNIRIWGDAEAPPLFLVHGMRDSSATFQFLVDSLQKNWFIIAPDLRGHGGSDRASTGYWFHDFVADLDVTLHSFADRQPVPVVGHSLGGNVATILASLFPHRFSHIVSLDGFGPLVCDLPVHPKSF